MFNERLAYKYQYITVLIWGVFKDRNRQLAGFENVINLTFLGRCLEVAWTNFINTVLLPVKKMKFGFIILKILDQEDKCDIKIIILLK